MKKALVLLLAVVYITLTSGVAVNVHYCMGKITGKTYGVEADHQCDRCGMEKKSGCCETEHRLVKADDDHIYTPSVAAKAPVIVAITTAYPAFFTPVAVTPPHATPRYHAPPGIQTDDLCVLHSVFRI
ncbi:MAG: hypothetical protein JNK79_08430 [Chitinophagaceae bacterium]|nr:hypothetical protein [Chitinophagaceae bacterium]